MLRLVNRLRVRRSGVPVGVGGRRVPVRILRLGVAEGVRRRKVPVLVVPRIIFVIRVVLLILEEQVDLALLGADQVGLLLQLSRGRGRRVRVIVRIVRVLRADEPGFGRREQGENENELKAR